LGRTSVAIEPPPDALAAYLRGHRPDYDALGDAVAQGAALASESDRPWEVSLLLQVILADGLLLELEGDHARASRRVDAAGLAGSSWLRTAALVHRPIAVVPLDLALVETRKLESPGGWIATIRAEDLRADAARVVDERAGQILEVARQGDARRVLFHWGVQPSFPRFLLLPLYRRRLAQGAELLASRAESIATGASREPNDATQQRDEAFNAPPLGPVPGIVREAVLGLQLADLSERRSWPLAQESDGASDVDALIDDLETTRIVLALRIAAGASEGCWPASLAGVPDAGVPDAGVPDASDFVLLAAPDCAIRLARRTGKPEPVAVFEAPRLAGGAS
jgi:hypothetical protein